jgi:hypothetical protein
MGIVGAPQAEVVAMAETDPVLARLEDQLAWYGRESTASERAYKGIKALEIVAAALIPFLTAIDVPYWKWIVGGLGVLITALEGLIQLNQYNRNWISYRATDEALKREKFLYLAGAGPYAGAINPRAVLAEHVEAIIAQENAKWVVTQQEAQQRQIARTQLAPAQKPGAGSEATSSNPVRQQTEQGEEPAPRP